MRCSRTISVRSVVRADILGVSQQTIAAYEVCRRQIQVSALPVIAQALGVAVETLVGEAPTATRKRGPAPKLQQDGSHHATAQSPTAVRHAVIDSMLTQSAR